MTIIQPHQNTSFINKILVLLFAIAIFLVAVFVVIYNKSVDLEHRISESKAKIRDVKTSNAELKEKIFNVFNEDSLNKVIAEKKLVKDREPYYIEVENQFAVKSL